MSKNLLPKDGLVTYQSNVVEQSQAAEFYQKLFKEIAWRNDEIIIFGKKIITSRKTAWYGDKEFVYQYSKIDRFALSWTPTLKIIKKLVEEIVGENFNSCLLNLYHSGEEGMCWHCDNENSIIKNSTIASLSLGAERKFSFKHKLEQESISLNLENASLLLMKNQTQQNWLHSLPKSKKVKEPRINLTFRKMVE
ncbi:MAG: alpha-ketoglutarate-dependent dioxygenase AlkB [Proteobacteria bacterium]|nr:alpha-ketoglutarate-dependent dioxygenase AlkB [Pseudomonadota bacterium]